MVCVCAIATGGTKLQVTFESVSFNASLECMTLGVPKHYEVHQEYIIITARHDHGVVAVVSSVLNLFLWGLCMQWRRVRQKYYNHTQ